MAKQFGVGDRQWTKEELLFHAMIWKTVTRMWGASKALTFIMQRPKTISDVIWNTVELITRNGEFAVWSREDGTPFPVLGEQ